MMGQDLTEQDARRLAAIARAKAERWIMLAQELEASYALRSTANRMPRSIGPATSADIHRVIGEGAKRKGQIADLLQVPLIEIEPLLTPEHGIEVNQQGWVKIINNGSMTAEHRDSKGAPHDT